MVRRKIYDIINLEHNGLFCPEDYGFRPTMIHSGCYDGFYARYHIDHKCLILDRLTIYSEDKAYPVLNGATPKPSRQGYGCMVYDNVNLHIAYTGAIRLGRDLMQRHSVHTRQFNPSAYCTVIDCIFEGGLLVRWIDRSPDAVTIRMKFRHDFCDLPNSSVMDRIDRAFPPGMELQ
jgi:hypothetical protein